MSKTLYHVSEGAVRPATDDDQCNGIESVLVLAHDHDDAFRVAKLYDDGVLSIDNHVDPRTGVIVACVADFI